jgi:hypothetical protein
MVGPRDRAAVSRLESAMNLGVDFLQWALRIFGAVAVDRHERALRFLEEAIEVAHHEGVTEAEIDALKARVFTKPAGNIGREIGQAALTLEGLACNIGHSAFNEAMREFGRVKEIPAEVWRERHAAKVALGIAK